MNYNNKVRDAISNLKHPVFIYPKMPQERFELDKEGYEVYQKPKGFYVEEAVRKNQYLWDKLPEVSEDSIPTGLGSCYQALWAQLEGTKGFHKINTGQDAVELLPLVRSICCRHDQSTDKTYAIVQLLKSLIYFYEYLKEFKSCFESINDFDACTLGKFPCLVKKNLDKVYNKTLDMATQDEISKYKDL